MLLPQGPRSCWDAGHSHQCLTFEVLCPDLLGTSSGPQRINVCVPRGSSVADLKREACAELFISEDQVDLWDFFGGRCYACLEERLSHSITSARLMDHQAVLLKGRQGKPLSPMSFFGDAWSKPPDVLLVFDDGSRLPAHRCVLELCSPLLQDMFAQGLTRLRDLDLPLWQQQQQQQQQPQSGSQRSYSPSTPTCSSQLRPEGCRGDSPPVTPRHQGVATASGSAHGHHAAAAGAQGQGGHAAGHPAAAALLPNAAPAPGELPEAAQRPRPEPQYPPPSSGTLHRCAGSSPQRGPAAPHAALHGVPHGDAGSASGGPGAACEADMACVRVPGDDRFSWLVVLKLLYPCCYMRRPPVTWNNVARVVSLADKWMISSVLRVCEDFLLQPTSQFTHAPADPAFVWGWLVQADRLGMPLVVRKAIAAVQHARCAAGHDRAALDAAVRQVVTRCSPEVVTQLITGLCAFKDELQAAAGK